MEIKKYRNILLPHFFKKIGLAMVALIFITMFCFKEFEFQFSESQKEIFKLISKNIFVAGLVIFAFSKDKVENESKNITRLSSFAGSVAFAVLIEVLTKEPDEISGFKIITLILFWYIFTFYTQRKSKYNSPE